MRFDSSATLQPLPWRLRLQLGLQPLAEPAAAAVVAEAGFFLMWRLAIAARSAAPASRRVVRSLLGRGARLGVGVASPPLRIASTALAAGARCLPAVPAAALRRRALGALRQLILLCGRAARLPPAASALRLLWEAARLAWRVVASAVRLLPTSASAAARSWQQSSLARSAPAFMAGLLPGLAALSVRDGHITRQAVRRGGARVVRVARRPKVLLTAAALASLLSLGGDEGVRRSLSFHSKMVPMAVEYRTLQWLLQPAKKTPLAEALRADRFQRLHERHAPEVFAKILELRGFYIKIGQVLSSFGDSFIPSQFVDSLSVLHDAAPTQDAQYVRDVIEEELGAKIDDLFEEFDETPLGAASIGQVHAARLRPYSPAQPSLEVVVKVQFPDAERFFTNDVRTLRTFCRVFSPENVELMDEIERQFEFEFDYRLEARLLRQAAENHKGFASVVVPLPLDASHPFCVARRAPGMCTRRCLVMERLRGASLLAAQREQLQAAAARRNTTAELLRKEVEEAFREGELAPPLLPSATIVALWSRLLAGRDGLANFVRRLRGLPPARRTPPPLNVRRLVAQIFDVHGYQLLHDGFFNGDPHPGNVFLCDDGRIGLLDWGQVKRIDLPVRLNLARLFIALADRDAVATAALWTACGFRTARQNPWCVERWAVWRFSRMSPDVYADLGGVANFESTLGGLDPILSEPEEYIMAFRFAALLRGNAMGLGDLRIDSAAKWRGHAVRLLKRHGEPLPETQLGRRLPGSPPWAREAG